MKKNELKKIVKKIFLHHGLSNQHAEISTNYLIKAELFGLPSHGLVRLKMYCNRLMSGLINSKPKIKIKNISKSISYIDADDSIGFVAADIGINKAIKNAQKSGLKTVDTVDEINCIVGMLFDAGSHCENIGVENDVFGRDAYLFGE